MFSLLGGRTNPKAIDAVKNFYVYGHGGQTDSYQTYHVYRFNDMAYMQDSVKEAFIDAIKATRVTIQGSIACRNVLTGTAEIVGKLTMGASLAKDATLVACKADGTVLYTSAPVAKTETAQTEYIFTLDTSSFEDGEITLKIFYRTAAEDGGRQGCNDGDKFFGVHRHYPQQPDGNDSQCIHLRCGRKPDFR